jgi:hypothetical protein
LQEDLQCQARRFFLADELMRGASDPAALESLRAVRRAAMSRIRVSYSNLRRDHSPDEGVARRYYLKIDKRAYEVIEEERLEKERVAEAEAETKPGPKP